MSFHAERSQLADAAQPVIAADRFVLRPLRRSDAGPIGQWCGDARVARGTRTIPHPLPPGAAEALVARASRPDRTEDIWALDGTASGSGELLGLVQLARMDRGHGEIGFWIAPPYWNTGLARAAVRAVVAANPRDDDVIVAEVFQDNPSAARALTHAGFDYLGDAESFSVARGENVPTWTYAQTLRRP